MKKFFNFIASTSFAFVALSSCSDDFTIPKPDLGGSEGGGSTEEVVLDTIEYRTLVYVDRAGVEQYGGEKAFNNKLDDLFNKVTKYWNSCGKGNFEYYFRYTVADVEIYDGYGNDTQIKDMVYNQQRDNNKYDVTVFFDLVHLEGEQEHGGCYCGTYGTDRKSVVTMHTGIAESPMNIFIANEYQVLTHELGHYRGVTDIYQYNIAASDNPVNHTAYDADDCIMNYYWVEDCGWSEYAWRIMNFTAKEKMPSVTWPRLFEDMYPKTIEIDVTLDGAPKRGVVVNLYGSRAGGATHGRDIMPEPFVSYQSDKDGRVIISDVESLYIPDPNKYDLPESMPYGRWFGFLAEIKCGSQTKYLWLPEYKVQMGFFNNSDTYQSSVRF